MIRNAQLTPRATFLNRFVTPNIQSSMHKLNRHFNHFKKEGEWHLGRVHQLLQCNSYLEAYLNRGKGVVLTNFHRLVAAERSNSTVIWWQAQPLVLIGGEALRVEEEGMSKQPSS